MALERRAEICQALYRCIAQRGYANTSVRDIAREAGVQSGLIHHYFESKNDILSDLMKHIFERYRQDVLLLSERHQDRPPRERLRLGIDFIFTKVSGDKDLAKVFHEVWDISQHDPKLYASVRTLYRQYRKEVKNFIAEHIGDSDADARTLQDLAAFLVSTAEGAGIQWFLDPRGISLSRLSRMACQFVEFTILPDRNQTGPGTGLLEKVSER